MDSKTKTASDKVPPPGSTPAAAPSPPSAERVEPTRVADPSVVRGRPGRRSKEEKRQAVLALLSGKASVDQLARQYGVSAETITGWRDRALVGIDEVLASGEASSVRERDLEREVRDLREALGRVTLEREMAMKVVEEWKRTGRPTRPAWSRR